MNQRQVWDTIAGEWDKYRSEPRDEAVEFLKNKKGLVLDLGCANGRNFVKIDGTLVGADFSYRMLRFAKRKAKENGINAALVSCDAAELPFRDNSFDNVLFANTLPSIKWNKHKKTLNEIKRVAKNRADIFISVWNKDQPRFQKAKRESFIPWTIKGKEMWSDAKASFLYRRYYYLYSKDELESLLKKYFKNVRVFGSREKAFKKYPKNIIAVARVAK